MIRFLFSEWLLLTNSWFNVYLKLPWCLLDWKLWTVFKIIGVSLSWKLYYLGFDSNSVFVLLGTLADFFGVLYPDFWWVNITIRLDCSFLGLISVKEISVCVLNNFYRFSTNLFLAPSKSRWYELRDYFVYRLREIISSNKLLSFFSWSSKATKNVLL